MAKLDEFKSYLDKGALRIANKRKLSRDVNFLTGRWLLTLAVLLKIQSAMGLSRFPGQARLGAAHWRSYCDPLCFWIVSFGPLDCLFFKGNTTSSKCGKVATWHRIASLDGRSVPFDLLMG